MRSPRGVSIVLLGVLSVGLVQIIGLGFISAPGAVPASGCRVGAVLSTDEFTSTGFSQVRTVGPSEEAPVGAWVLADDFVPTTSVAPSPNCPGAGPDFLPLFVVALELTPTIGSWQEADIQTLELIRDTNCNAEYEPGLDLVMQSRSGDQLRQGGSVTFFNGPQSALFRIPSAGGALFACGFGAIGIMVVVEIGSNPASGSQFGLSLEALAADVPGGGVTSSGFASSRNPAGSSIRLQVVGGQGGGGTTPPPGGGGGSSIAAELQPYDANGNDRLEDREFLDTIDDWVDRQLSDSAFFAAIDIWINQGRISSASVADDEPTRTRVQARITSQGVRFAAIRATSLSVDVYGLDGRSVFSQTTSGSTLSWNLQTSDGVPVANGVYLYRTTVTTAEGQTVRGNVRKLIIRR